MIVLDTNLVSEFMTSPPAPAVRAWLNSQATGALHLTTISIAEIEFGLMALPEGNRRRLLASRFEQFVELAFGERILVFDEPAAHLYGRIRAERRARGRPISNFDAQIAAITRANSFRLATRNVKDFDDCGVELINPFDD
ncbi:type II toxin-antitoxin system VapC family toxin [Thioalkalicoccus limnaeus]|uniref:Ribonuclease VapC n=1 Tax=Thioalkalicoccus limnaeus TaxID=120681 RepID=A0ABV4BCY9_9GAMM